MLDKITEILRDYKSDEALEVKESSTFEELELDSLDLVQLIMEVEEAFEVTIEMDTPISTVSELIEIIKKADA